MQKSLVFTAAQPLSPAKLHELADEGWTIIDAWKLREDEYGKGAVNFILQRPGK